MCKSKITKQLNENPTNPHDLSMPQTVSTFRKSPPSQCSIPKHGSVLFINVDNASGTSLIDTKF